MSEEQIEEGQLNDLLKVPSLKIDFQGTSGSIGLAGKVNNLFSNLPELQQLRLYGLQGYSTPTWLNLTSFPNLRYLSIFFSKSLSQMNTTFWCSRDGKWKLEVFVLGFLDKLEEEWPKIKEAMPCLRLLRLSSVPS